MYKNIGKKIKILAIIISIVCAVIFIASGVLTIINSAIGYYRDNSYTYNKFIFDGIIPGIITIIIGPLLSWLFSFAFYGYGHLIDTNQKTADALQKICDKLDSPLNASQDAPELQHNEFNE